MFILRLVILLATFAACATANDTCRNGGINTTVPGSFISNEPLVISLLQLGARSGTCFGLRALDAVAFTRSLHVSVRDATVRHIIVSLLEQLPDYEMQESSSNVVLVGRLRSIPKGSVFEVTVREFRSPRSSLKTVSNALKLQLAAQMDPTIRGFVGTYGPGDQSDLVGPIDEHEKKVWELLNDIVGQSAGAMWFPAAPELDAAKPTDISPWTIIEYSTPYSEASITIQELIPHFQTPEPEKGKAR